MRKTELVNMSIAVYLCVKEILVNLDYISSVERTQRLNADNVSVISDSVCVCVGEFECVCTVCVGVMCVSGLDISSRPPPKCS